MSSRIVKRYATAFIYSGTKFNKLRRSIVPPRNYSKNHTLSDGSVWTSFMIAEETGINLSTIRARLCRNKNVKDIFAPKYAGTNKKGLYKLYTLDDGSQWTVPEIVKETGITRSCAGARLSKSKERAIVLAPPLNIETVDTARKKRARKETMCFGQRDFWTLLNANT